MSLHHVRNSKKKAFCKPERGTKQASTLILDFSAPRILRNTFLLFKPGVPNSWAMDQYCEELSCTAGEQLVSKSASKASSVFTGAPHHSNYHLSSSSCEISGGIRVSQELELYCELHIGGGI